MENITASELAGFGVGTLLFCATIAAPKIDALISASQRSSLGMCKRCGDLKMIACSKCKGVGLIKDGPLSFSLGDESFQSLGGRQAKVGSISCTRCQAKGHMCCPDCSKSP
ncbi:hypothetical protein BVC80_1745g12 [Macleaya cordata]|uniref:Uncharacterized protein n=1 Tax=Macleaya cordata TaxID=56857 RepID=A0A200QKP5_MACCD|nr:hypothetical protein BVC80_1745g12 [Macleaya cordata]